MKVLPIFLVALLACSALFFYAPHHRRNGVAFRPATLSQIFGEFFRDLPEISSRGQLWFVMLAFAGIVASFYPAVLILMVRWASPPMGESGGGLFILGGLVALVGALANFVAILVSHMTIGFGGGSSSGDETPFCWILPMFQLLFAAASLAIGCSATCANWLGRLVRF